jgi:hypothetical protein
MGQVQKRSMVGEYQAHGRVKVLMRTVTNLWVQTVRRYFDRTLNNRERYDRSQCQFHVH